MKLTRTGKIIFAVVIVVLSAALGYLIWRINNESNLGPDDSQAGGGGNGGGCCLPVLVNGNLTCPFGTGSTTCNNKGACCGATQLLSCGDGSSWCTGPGFLGYPNNCSACTDSDLGDDQNCHSGQDCKDCVYPKVGFCISGDCKCLDWSTQIGTDGVTVPCVNSGDTFTCAASCPDGMVECDSGDSGCVAETTNCNCPVCNNPTQSTIYCKTAPSNVCDKGGSWKTKPAASIKHGDNVTFSATATDSDGIDTSSVKVTKNGTAMSKCTGSTVTDCYTVSESGTTATISGTLASPDSGNYTIAMDWKDKKGAGGTDCALSTAFAVQVPETNPDWDITKNVVEECIDENTENPKSQLTYAITVKNTGDGSGSFTKIEDVLDSKVLDSFVQTSSITGGGVYSSGKIIWDFSSNPVSVAAGESKSYTYTLVVDKGHFDTYANTVTLTPAGSDSISANANITADCEISEPPIVPQTGIFDNAAVRIIAGIILLTFGVIVYRIPSMSLSIYIRNGKMYIRDKNISKIRERFEKRVANS